MEFFLSYNTKDKQLASQVKNSFEIRGQTAFLAHEDILPSVEWVQEIQHRLEDCTALIAIVTPDFVRSDYTNQEAGFIMGRRKPVISLRFSGARLPGFLQVMQAIDVTTDNLASQIGKTIQAVERRLTESLVRPSIPTTATDFTDSLFDRRRERYWRASVRPLEPYLLIPASGETDKWLVANCPYIFQHLTSKSLANGLVFERSDNGPIHAEVRTNGEIAYGTSLSNIEKVHLERATQVAGNTMEFASRIVGHFPHDQNRSGHVMVELKLALAHRQAMRCNQVSETLDDKYVTDEDQVIVQKNMLFEQIESDWRTQLDLMMIELCRHFGLAIEPNVARKVSDMQVPKR